jgi:hypothetical protein
MDMNSLWGYEAKIDIKIVSKITATDAFPINI